MAIDKTASPQVVNKSIVIDAPAAKVWQVLTISEAIREWISDDGGLAVQTDWTVGHPFGLVGTFHGMKHRDQGTLLHFEPERVFAYSSWSRISRVPDRPENYAVVEFRLSPEGGGTRLTLSHSNLVILPMYQHANFYWNGTLRKIKRLAETPTSFV
jgi:uncharacterized protein YndB with AHSA1/START domain